MGSKSSVSAVLYLTVNIICYALATTVLSPGTSLSNPKPNPMRNPKPNPMSSLVTNNQSLSCPRDALKLGVCGNLLGGLIGVFIGNRPTATCCTLLAGLVDLEAAVCLCTAIRANVLGINVNASLSLTLLFNVCGRTLPPGYTCA
ncbi:14 kDa proline-rich protein DC2.15-like [Cornus florida]|uniref:14 kDa proline-rich protein DC2.15-like n=1 Tax=Cornus florida TaxID=4283 RepID=UPI0028990E2F|nr:14 kDa proline-rich protein DC2.15-like [Cornus florida]